VLAGKVRALFNRRFNVSLDDIRAVAVPCLRHRLILNFEGEAEGIESAELISDLLKRLPEQAMREATLTS
jgi:MoxR-like ATPase